MSDHPYVQHPVFTTRDHCEHRNDEEKDGAYGACGEPKSTHVAAPATTALERKRWPRKVGWTKLLARRKACKHFFVQRIIGPDSVAASVCPDCLIDEVAYWKSRTHSAEGQRNAMLRVVEKAIKDELIVERPKAITV